MMHRFAIPLEAPRTEDDLRSLAVRVLGDLGTMECMDSRETLIHLALQIVFYAGRTAAMEAVAQAQEEVISAALAR